MICIKILISTDQQWIFGGNKALTKTYKPVISELHHVLRKPGEVQKNKRPCLIEVLNSQNNKDSEYRPNGNSSSRDQFKEETSQCKSNIFEFNFGFYSANYNLSSIAQVRGPVFFWRRPGDGLRNQGLHVCLIWKRMAVNNVYLPTHLLPWTSRMEE